MMRNGWLNISFLLLFICTACVDGCFLEEEVRIEMHPEVAGWMYNLWQISEDEVLLNLVSNDSLSASFRISRYDNEESYYEDCTYYYGRKISYTYLPYLTGSIFDITKEVDRENRFSALTISHSTKVYGHYFNHIELTRKYPEEELYSLTIEDDEDKLHSLEAWDSCFRYIGSFMVLNKEYKDVYVLYNPLIDSMANEQSLRTAWIDKSWGVIQYQLKNNRIWMLDFQ